MRHVSLRLRSAFWALFLCLLGAGAQAADLGVKTSNSTLATKPYGGGTDRLPVAHGSAWQVIDATILNPFAGTNPGTVPAPGVSNHSKLLWDDGWGAPTGIGGANQQLQYNNNGVSGGIAGVTYDSSAGLFSTTIPLNLTNESAVADVANASSTGTTQFKLAKLTGATAVIAGTSDTDGVIGIVRSGAGTTGNAQIARVGVALCVFDAPIVAGDWVVTSTTSAGACHDAGNTRPTSVQTIGRIITATNASPGTFAVLLDGLSLTGTGGGGTSPGGLNGQIEYNNAGNFGGLIVGSALTTATNTLNVTAHGITLAMHAQAAANKLLGNAANGTADIAELSAPGCTDTNGQHWNYTAGTGFSCGNSVRFDPNHYVGTTTNSGNVYAIASPNPASPAFSLTNQYTVRAVINAVNTGTSTLNVAGTGATTIEIWTGAGFAPLTGGELQASYEAEFIYNSTCTCFVFMNPPTGQISIGALTGTITQAEWAAGTEKDPTSASQTFTLPASSTLSPQGGLGISALNFSTAVQANAADTITAGGVTTATGATVTIPLSVQATVKTDGAGHIYLSPGKIVGGVLVMDVTAGGTGLAAVADNQILVATAANTYTAKTVGDCQDSGGNHLNYTQSTHTISCGTTNSGGGGSSVFVSPQGRLTLTANTPVMIADNSGTSTIYYVCFVGNAVPYWTGAADANDTIASCQVSDVVPTSGTGVVNTGNLADLWWVHAGAHLCHVTNGSGGGWASDTAGTLTARGTGYTQVDTTTRPYPTNTNILTNCYNGSTNLGAIAANQATLLGTFYTTAAGQTKMQTISGGASGGANTFLGLSNAHNRVAVNALGGDSDTWTGTGLSTYAAAHASASNRITYVDSLARANVSASVSSGMQNSGSGLCILGVSRNSTSAGPNTSTSINSNFSGIVEPASVPAPFLPSAGLNFLQVIELTSSANCTFYGLTETAMISGM